MPGVVTTLFEGEHHKGVVALANSLSRNGYSGRLWAAYRGEPPPWARDTAESASGVRRIVAGTVEIALVSHRTAMHFTHFKPWWMQEVIDKHEPTASSVFYFDPDIVVCSRWSYFEEWAGYGVALCEDNHYHVGADHPLRHAWSAFARDFGRPITRNISGYINAGFVGLKTSDLSFLKDWAQLITSAQAESGSLEKWRTLDRTHRFSSTNQDTLNLAAMITAHPLAIYGPDGMDFMPSAGRPMMSHAIGLPKPWQKSYLLSAICGVGPSRADRRFWEYADGPLQLYSPATIRIKRAMIKAAAFVGRFYRRG
jgi:hypothetical protein